MAFQHGFAVLTERIEILAEDCTTTKGLRLVYVDLEWGESCAIEAEEFVVVETEDSFLGKPISALGNDLHHYTDIRSN